jgi:aspartate/methionine/tyrosine aminotransferase
METVGSQKMNNPNLQFGWGDTDGIREIMLNLYPSDFESSDLFSLDQGYPAHEGHPELIEEIKKLIKNLTKKDYKHVIITNGATNGLCASLHSLSPKEIFINDRYFGFYPGITKQFSRNVQSIPLKDSSFHHQSGSVVILDSPSNPRGDLITELDSLSATTPKVIWDAAYWSPTYVTGLDNMPMPTHDIMVGSLSKLTGINGIRVGWVATDSDEIYAKAADYVTHNLCGVSGLSQDLAKRILTHVNLEKFYSQSNQLLQDNKNELSSVANLFGGQPIPDLGMFAYWNADDLLLSKIKEAGIVFTCGSSVGGNKNEVRINLARKRHLTKNLVDILKKI